MSDAGTTTTTTTTPPAWHAGMDAELVGHAQLKGWDLSEPGKAFEAAAKAYRAAEQHVGVPPDQLLKLPKDTNDAEGWKQVWQRLGAPKDPAEYSFEGIDFGEQTASFTDTVRGVMAKHNLPKAAAEELAREVHKWVSGRDTTAAAETTAIQTVAQEQLRREWGAGYEVNRIEAEQFVSKVETLMGGGEGAKRAVEAIQAVIKDNAFVAKMFHTMAKGLKEDTHQGGGGNTSGPMTNEMALARRTELLADPSFNKRWLEGGVAEGREMMNINRIIAAGLEARGL